jgi:hypothetical protein
MLEAEGIPVMFRNLHLAMSGLSEIPIAEFYPNICVMRDEDFLSAWEVLRRAMHENAVGSDREVESGGCGEKNPGNFDFCFSCREELRGD